jgi:hypothetical protein
MKLLIPVSISLLLAGCALLHFLPPDESSCRAYGIQYRQSLPDHKESLGEGCITDLGHAPGS